MADRLPVVNKLLYTADLVGTQAMAQSRHLWLLFFLAPPADEGVAAAVPAVSVGPLDIDPRIFVGIVLTAGRLIEAIDDPIIGWWSDRTRSRWGRRIPFVLFGTPFYALFFALLWLTPGGDSSYLNAIYLFIVLELFFFATTITGGPYEALLPEIAPGHRDRMSIVAWQFYFGIAGAVAGLVLSGLIKDQVGFFAMGAIFAAAGPRLSLRRPRRRLAPRAQGNAGGGHRAPVGLHRDAPQQAVPLLPAHLRLLPARRLDGDLVAAFLRDGGPAERERGRRHLDADRGRPVRQWCSRRSRCGSWATARASVGYTPPVCSARPFTCRSSSSPASCRSRRSWPRA